ncbi:MAG: type II CAAX endopeptidase family protein [Bacteroidota bacterium]
MQALSANDSFSKPIYALLGLFLFVLFFGACGSFLMQGLAYFAGTDYQDAIIQLKTNNTLDIRNYVRLASIISQVTTFLLPALLLIVFIHPSNWKQVFKIHQRPHFQLVALGVIFLFATFPIAQWLLAFNKSLPLPEWATSLEEDLGALSTALLVMESPWELLFNIFAIAVIPAIGEELLFRGVLQQKLQDWTKQPHLGVWLAAIIFSAFHGQFEGFLARLLLGAALGYLLCWTNNLWIPILAHFFNNALQVTVQYFSNTQLEMDRIPEIPTYLLLLSLILAAVLAYFILHFNRKTLVHDRKQTN